MTFFVQLIISNSLTFATIMMFSEQSVQVRTKLLDFIMEAELGLFWIFSNEDTIWYTFTSERYGLE